MIFSAVLYGAAWALILNLLWVLHLAAHDGFRLNALFRASTGARTIPGEIRIPAWRANLHLAASFIAAVLGSYALYRGAFGFLPSSWGPVDSSGVFQPFLDTFAILLALVTAYLVLAVVIRSSDHQVAAERARNASDELRRIQKTTDEALHKAYSKFQEMERAVDAQQERHQKEVRILQDEVTRIRALVPKDLLVEANQEFAFPQQKLARTYQS